MTSRAAAAPARAPPGGQGVEDKAEGQRQQHCQTVKLIGEVGHSKGMGQHQPQRRRGHPAVPQRRERLFGVDGQPVGQRRQPQQHRQRGQIGDGHLPACQQLHDPFGQGTAIPRPARCPVEGPGQIVLIVPVRQQDGQHIQKPSGGQQAEPPPVRPFQFPPHYGILLFWGICAPAHPGRVPAPKAETRPIFSYGFSIPRPFPGRNAPFSRCK